MKKHLIAAAIGSMGLAATSAYALPPGSTINYTIYAGSGSAQVNAHYWAATQLLTSLDSYTDSTSCGESGTWRILTGTTTAALNDGKGTTIPSGSNVLYIVRSSGGTFPNAIGSVANATTLAYPALSAVNGASTNSNCTGAPHPKYQFASGYATTTAIPSFGTSDEEIGLFNTTANVPGTYSTAGDGTQTFTPGTVLTASQVANLSHSGLYVNIMGLAETSVVYNGTTAFPHPKTNFTKPEIEGILTGAIVNWNQLFADDGTVMPNQNLILLDRAPGSGTKAAMNVYFLLDPNAPNGAQTPLNETAETYTPTPLPTTSCSSSVPASNVDFNESSSTTLFQDLETQNGLGCYAIGILGLEFSPQVENTTAYSFVKINGVDPFAAITTGGHVYATYANEISGSYDLMFTNSFNYRTKSINGGGYLGDGQGDSVWLAQFKSKMADGHLPGGVSGEFPAGVTGLLLDPFVQGGNGQCVTSGSHFLNSQAPLQLYVDATFAAAPACNDELQ